MITSISSITQKAITVRSNHFAVCLLTCFLLVGAISSCTSTAQNLLDDSSLVVPELPKGRSLVVGQVYWLENGKQKEIGKRIFEFYVKPNLLRLEDRAGTLCNVGKEGEFAWALSPGTYVIDRIVYRDTWSGNYFFMPQIAFRIGAPQKTYYIGTLKADLETKRDLIGGLSGKASFSVLDQSDEFYPDLVARSSIDPDSIVKSLMVHEKGLPRRFVTSADFNMALQLLNTMLPSD
jgi:hypothetical protein